MGSNDEDLVCKPCGNSDPSMLEIVRKTKRLRIMFCKVCARDTYLWIPESENPDDSKMPPLQD